jgi:hypothetical protein
MTMIGTIAVVVLSAGLLAHLPSGQAQDVTPVFKVVSTPNPDRFLFNDLFAASASSSTDIWAVGYAAIHYDGTSWTGFPVPGVGSTGSKLWGVATISPTNAWAVGSFRTSETTTGNLQHWDGTQWSVSSGDPLARGEILGSIAAISADDIWAGMCIPSDFEHFDGTQWTFVYSGGTGSPDGESCVQSISAISSNDVWAAGWINYSGNTSSTQIQHWDGTQWTVTPSPNVGTGSNQLFGIVALADNNVWAVGDSVAPDTGIEYPNQTLIEHWDGTSWVVVPSPNVEYNNLVRDNVLQGIVAVSPNDLWAFGWFAANPSGESGDEFSLVLHWNGTSWSVVPSPNPSGDPTLINDPLYAGVFTSGSLWLVGSEATNPANLPNGPADATLVLLHTTGR